MNKQILKIMMIAIITITLTACGGESSPPITDNNTITKPVPTTPPSINPITEPADLAWFAAELANYMGMSTSYSSTPNTGSCEAGEISTQSQTDFLLLVNKIRGLHGLKSLTLGTMPNEMQEAALMMDANNKLDHHPTSDWTCYTSAGDTGAGASNLGLGYYTLGTAIVRGWLQDGGVYSLGHRRWVLAPSMVNTVFGDVGRGYAMQTMGYGGSDTVPFIAYPYREYPTDLIGNARWSFSVNDGSVYSSSVNYSNATVNISDIGNVPFDDLGANYGSGGTIAWDYPRGVEANVPYTVTISGVTGAPESTYTYTVTIID